MMWLYDMYVEHCRVAEVPLWWPMILPVIYMIACGICLL